MSDNDALSCWKDQMTFVSDYPQFDRGQIGYLMRNRLLNGLDEHGAVKKIGRKLYIHVPRFTQWIESLGVEKKL